MQKSGLERQSSKSPAVAKPNTLGHINEIMIPDKSTISIKNGVWFVLHDGINSIKIYCSNLGKEEIYLNNNLISEKRSIKVKREYSFEDKDGTKYQVKFDAANIRKGMECYIFKEKELIKIFKTRYVPGKEHSKKALIIYLPTIIFTLIIKYYNLPWWYYLLSIMLVVTFYLKIKEPGKLVIEEESNTMA